MAQQDLMSNDNVGVEFDPSTYASLLKKELITYSFTWDPLLQILQTLGASSTKVQKLQQNSSQKMAEFESNLQLFQNQMDSAETDKKLMADTINDLQKQVKQLQVQMAEVEEAKETRNSSTDEVSQTEDDTIKKDPVDTGGKVTIAATSFGDDVEADGKESGTLESQVHQIISDYVRRADLEELKLYLMEKLDGRGGAAEITTVDRVDAGEISRSPKPGLGIDDNSIQARLSDIEKFCEVHEKMLQETNAAIALMQSSKPAFHDKIESQIDNLEAAKSSLEEAVQRSRKDNEQQAQSCDQLRDTLNRLERDLGRHTEDLEQCHGKIDEDKADLRRVKGILDDLLLQHKTLVSLKHPSLNESEIEGSETRENGLAKTSPASAQYDFSMIFQRLSDIRQSTETSIESVQRDMGSVKSTIAQHEEVLSTMKTNSGDQLHDSVESIRIQLESEKSLVTLASNDFKAHKASLQNAFEQIEVLEKEEISTDSPARGILHAQIERLIRLLSNTSSKSSASFAIPDLVTKNLAVLSEIRSRTERKLKGGSSEFGSSETSEILRQLRLLDDDILELTQRKSLLEEERNLVAKNTEDIQARLLNFWSLRATHYVQKALMSGVKGATLISTHTEHPNSNLKDTEPASSLRQPDAGDLLPFDKISEDLLHRVDVIESTLRDKATFSSPMNSSSHEFGDKSFVEGAELDQLRQEMFDEIAKLSRFLTDSQRNRPSSANDDARSAQHDNNPPMTQSDYDSLVHLVVQRVTQSLGNITPSITREQSASSNLNPQDDTQTCKSGRGTTPNFNNLAVLDKIMQQVDQKTNYLQDWNNGEIARIRKEMLEHLRRQLEEGLRDLRAELSIYYPMGPMDDTTAIGTKATVCIACSRPVPVSPMIREGPIANELSSEQAEVIIPQQQEQDVDRSDDDYVYRGGFRMPVQDRKNMTLPFLVHNPRPRQVSQSERSKPRPPLRGSPNRIDTVFKEAMELERNIRSRFQEQSNQK